MGGAYPEGRAEMTTPFQSARAAEVRRLREKGALQEALDLFPHIEEDDDGWNDLELVDELARAHSLAGDEQGVVRFFQRCADLNLGRAALYRCQVGWFYQRRKNWARALRWYEEALETFPNYHLCLFRKGYCLERQHRPRAAAAAFAAAAEVFEKSDADQRARSQGIQIQNLFHLSRNLRETGATAAARAALEKCDLLDTGPENIIRREHRLASRAEIALAENLPAEAVADLEAARKMENRSAVLWERLGRAYHALGRPTDAEAALRHATRLPKGAVSLVALARFLRAEKRLVECAETLHQGLREHPKGEVHLRLESARLELALDRPGKALAILERLNAGRVQAGSTQAVAIESAIGALHASHGDFARALPYLEAAAAQESAHDDTRKALAEARASAATGPLNVQPMQDAPLPAPIAAVLERAPQRIEGEVVSYFADRGFGFVAHGEKRDTIFFHVSQCQGLDGGLPEPGQAVTFFLARNRRSGKSQAEEILPRVRVQAATSAG